MSSAIVTSILHPPKALSRRIRGGKGLNPQCFYDRLVDAANPGALSELILLSLRGDN
jgi:hypothetical protein